MYIGRNKNFNGYNSALGDEELKVASMNIVCSEVREIKYGGRQTGNTV